MFLKLQHYMFPKHGVKASDYFYFILALKIMSTFNPHLKIDECHCIRYQNIKPNDIYYKEKWHKHPFQATQCVP